MATSRHLARYSHVSHSMRWPIRYQVLLPFAVISLSAVMMVNLVSAYLATRRAKERVDLQVQNLGRTMLGSSFPLTDPVLEQMHGLSGAHFVLVDEDGRVVATSQPSAHQRALLTSPVYDWRLLELGSPVRFDDENFFASALRMPGREPNRQPSVLHILYPESQWSSSRREAILPPLVGGLVTLFFSVLLSALVAGRISRPIGQLRMQVIRLAQGDFTTLALPARDDELRDLARSVNVLAEQLLEMRRAIRRAERLALLGQLSGALAHHLRNDITGTRMAVQLHQRRCSDGDRESLAVALRQLELTEQHLQRLLAAGQTQEPNRTHCDLLEIVEHIVQLVEPSCRHRNLSISIAPVEMSGNEPAPYQLEADVDQLRHLLMNLVVNAMEAVDEGGSVRIELQRRDAAIVVRVLDSGPGPPPELIPQLFEEFVTTKAEGVGLGLAAAQRIAESHSGKLRFSRHGEYTCFELVLPGSAARENEARHPPGNGEETYGPPFDHRRRRDDLLGTAAARRR